MRNPLIISLAFIFLFFLLSENAYSISLGSLVKNNQAELEPNESIEFVIFLWNNGESSIMVKFKEKSLPNDWFVIFKPNEIILEPAKPEQNPKEGMDYVSTSYGYVRTTPAKIIIKTSDTTRKGTYQVTVGAIANDERNGIISLIQERDFNFKINITKDGINAMAETQTLNNQTTQNTQIPEEVKNDATVNVTKVNRSNENMIIAIVLVIVFFVVLVKKIKYKS